MNDSTFHTDECAASVRVAVWGCGHGELDRVYDVVRHLNSKAHDKKQIELLICCGDFQAVRNEDDLECMACPPKYRHMGSFYKYYAGSATAPVTTIFVGGNHEAANHLQELFYGGWVAPNIFYLGSSGVFTFRGLRIAGISGIYKRYNFNEGYYERAPYSNDTMRSVFHVREFDYLKLSMIRSPVDVMISHDWPEGVYNHGDKESLLRKKSFFAEEIANDALGNPASRELLTTMRPRYWFAGHLHVKFAAIIVHGDAKTPVINTDAQHCAAQSAAAGTPSPVETRFLALDKCMPGRDFLQVVDIPVRSGTSRSGEHGSSIYAREFGACGGLCYDPEWLAVTAKVHAYTPTSKRYPPLPQFSPPTPAEVSAITARVQAASVFKSNTASPWCIPENFSVTATAFQPVAHSVGGSRVIVARPRMPPRRGNPQTDAFLSLLGLSHNVTSPFAHDNFAAGFPVSSSIRPFEVTNAAATTANSNFAPMRSGNLHNLLAPTQVMLQRTRHEAHSTVGDSSVNCAGIPYADEQRAGAEVGPIANEDMLQASSDCILDPDEIQLEGDAAHPNTVIFTHNERDEAEISI